MSHYQKGEFTISTNPAKLDLEVIHGYLSRSYWTPGIPKETVRQSIEHSLCFGLYEKDTQIGFARVITDKTSFAYLADVFVLETRQGHGLGKWLIHCIINHPDLQGLRRWLLATRDAHGLYAQYGFTPLAKPDTIMEKYSGSLYKSTEE